MGELGGGLTDESDANGGAARFQVHDHVGDK